jgi:hypothetical protein
MSRVSLCCLLVALVAAAVLASSQNAWAQEGQQRVILVAGYGASTRIDNEEFRELRKKNFAGQWISFFTNELYLNRERFLKAVQQADILFYSGHSGEPSSMPGMQVLVVKPSSGKKGEVLPATAIAQALSGGTGPRLVVVNGCCTTDPEDGVPSQNRIATAFGIAEGVVGRTYLGWSKVVPGFLADDQIGRLFAIWTVPGADGKYPTIEQARATVGIENLDIIGDSGLRYR